MPSHRSAVFILSALTCVFSRAAPPATRPIETGALTLIFDTKSPLGDPAKITKRAGWSLDGIKKQIEIDYDPAKETFDAVVPASYDASEPYGLFVWIGAGDDAKPPAGWSEVLARHKLIWVGATKSGNKRAVLIRIGLVFDAVDGMKSRYRIDPQRVYISGVSGGGKVASVIGVEYPEVFTGGFYFIGADFYRAVPSTPGREWGKAYNLPEPKLLMLERKRSRHVLLTGDKDLNRDPIRAFAAAFKADRFEHITLLDVPGLGHQLPDAAWFDKGLIALDEVPVAATKPAKKINPI